MKVFIYLEEKWPDYQEGSEQENNGHAELTQQEYNEWKQARENLSKFEDIINMRLVRKFE